MGKRELLIAFAFVFVGFAVYRVTAPPGEPSSTGFSLSKVFDEIRREIRGQRASAETTTTITHPVPEEVNELRVVFASGTITIIGEDREDIEAEFKVHSTGGDDAEAQRLAKESRLKFDEAGPLLIIASEYPEAGRQTPTLRLKVPARLGLRIDEKGSALEVENMASVTIGSGRGQSTIRHIEGPVIVTQRGNEIIISDVGSLRLTTFSGTEARVV